MAAEDNDIQKDWQPPMPQANIFGTDANGQPLYQTMFMPTKPSDEIPSKTNKPVAVGPDNVQQSSQPTDNNPNVTFEHQGGVDYSNPNPTMGNGPVSRVLSASDMLKQQNEPDAYHEDPDDPAGSAMKYIAGPPTEDSYKKASDNAKKIGLVADALRHIGNIINTTHYAPAQKINSTFDYLDQRERVKQQQRQAEAQQQSENDYRNFKKVIAMADQERKEREEQNQQDYRNANLYFKSKEDKRQDELQPDKVATGKANTSAAQSRAESAGYDALTKKIKSGAIQTQTDLDTEAKRLGIKLKQAELQKLQQQLSHTWKPGPASSGRSGGKSSGGSSSSGKGGGKGGRYKFRGVNYPNSAMYYKAVTDFAKKHNIPLDRQVRNGNKTFVKTRSIADIASAGEDYKVKPSFLSRANQKGSRKGKKF